MKLKANFVLLVSGLTAVLSLNGCKWQEQRHRISMLTTQRDSLLTEEESLQSRYDSLQSEFLLYDRMHAALMDQEAVQRHAYSGQQAERKETEAQLDSFRTAAYEQKVLNSRPFLIYHCVNYTKVEGIPFDYPNPPSSKTKPPQGEKNEVGYINISGSEKNIMYGNYPYYHIKPDAEVIDPKYLKQYDDGHSNYHTLIPRYRKVKLESMALEETDTAYIYYLEADTIIQYALNEMRLVASVNFWIDKSKRPFGYNQFDYEIGFEFDLQANAEKIQGLSFVYIGKVNPFKTGNIHNIKWEASNREEWPSVVQEVALEKKKSLPYVTYLGQGYQFTTSSHTYYYITVLTSPQSGVHCFMLLIQNLRTREIDHVQLMKRSEYDNITFPHDSDNSYTGEIFKYKPLMVYGLFITFPCPMIYFIGTKSEDILIICDNRY